MPDELEPEVPRPDDRRLSLRAECERCVGLCCVVPALSASADFAIDKAAGQACPHLGSDFRCAIHSRLRDEGFPGCTAYDCFGAGQRVTQVTFGGSSWVQEPIVAAQMFAVFPVVRQLHELLWYLTEALSLPRARSLRRDLQDARQATERLTEAGPDALVGLDLAAHRRHVDSLLDAVSELVRADAQPGAPDHRGADLVGAHLAGADLRGASFRGALLIGADLTGADLRTADFIGADLRGACLAGADLRDCIFLIQQQVNAARGDRGTKLPEWLTRPGHWRPTVGRSG